MFRAKKSKANVLRARATVRGNGKQFLVNDKTTDRVVSFKQDPRYPVKDGQRVKLVRKGPFHLERKI